MFDQYQANKIRIPIIDIKIVTKTIKLIQIWTKSHFLY